MVVNAEAGVEAAAPHAGRQENNAVQGVRVKRDSSKGSISGFLLNTWRGRPDASVQLQAIGDASAHVALGAATRANMVITEEEGGRTVVLMQPRFYRQRDNRDMREFWVWRAPAPGPAPTDVRVLRAGGSTTPFSLATALQAQLGSDTGAWERSPVVIDALGEVACAKALGAVSIARQQMLRRGEDLALVPCLVKQAAPALRAEGGESVGEPSEVNVRRLEVVRVPANPGDVARVQASAARRAQEGPRARSGAGPKPGVVEVSTEEWTAMKDSLQEMTKQQAELLSMLGAAAGGQAAQEP